MSVTFGIPAGVVGFRMFCLFEQVSIVGISIWLHYLRVWEKDEDDEDLVASYRRRVCEMGDAERDDNGARLLKILV